jgi:threonyl-tRNA synthetase
MIELAVKRHSFSHVMAQAVKQNFPDVKIAIGPDTIDGFYYDFDFGEIEFSDKNLKQIEKSMKKIISQNQKFEQYDIEINEAILQLKENREEYKLELAEKLKEN